MKKITGILVFILLLNPFIYGQQQNESILEKTLSLSITNQPISYILDKITEDAGIHFSYDATLVNSTRIESISTNQLSIHNTLKQLFSNELFNFYEKENQIILSLKNQAKASNNNVDSTNVKQKYIVLSGKLLDAKKTFPLPFASVSILNKPIGTITNADGEFLLKISPIYKNEQIIFSCLGYGQKVLLVPDLLDIKTISLDPISINIREISVKSITPEEILNNVFKFKIKNYGSEFIMMNAFYREIVKQDEDLINISEAVLDILKSPYDLEILNDKIRIQKARKTPEFNPFQWVNFKLQGGPFNITQLDIIKTVDTFIDPEYREYYNHSIDRVIWYHNHPVYVIKFKPHKNLYYGCYEGEIYIDRETYAIMHCNFKLANWGLRYSERSLIKKKPKGYKVRTNSVKYSVDYQFYNDKWYFNSAHAAVTFKVKNKKLKINSSFYSESDILVTNMKESQIKRFPRKQLFSINDIFIENITDYDENFWGNFNIIKPDENLRTALLKFTQLNQSLLNLHKPELTNLKTD